MALFILYSRKGDAPLLIVFFALIFNQAPASAMTTADANQTDDVDDYPLEAFRQNMCQDRHGYLSVTRFHHRSCAMCYLYLFLHNRELYVAPPYEQLIPRNSSAQGFGAITPDINNATAVEQVCNTLHGDECRRWKACCHEAVKCCERQRQTPFPERPQDVCLRTWDGYSCWDDTKPGVKVTTACPTFMEHSFSNRHSIKECTLNATWVRKEGLEWTDYRPCVDIEGVLVNVYICVACNSACVLLLLPSIVIFLIFRDLTRQHRIRLHINFFLSLLLRSLVVILWFLMVHHDKITNPNANEAVMIRNPVWCRVLSFFKLYLISTTYTWMFCEGYYLHRLISRAFEPPKSLITLYVIGWGFPIVPAVIYSIIRVVMNNDSCWIHNLGNLEWVLYVPNLFCLVLNIVFLSNILRILLFQLHSHPHEPNSFRRGLKAGFMLIPLFGIQLILTIYRPSADLATNFKAYEYTTTIIINSQGIFVALVFCFFNGEVLTHFYDRCPCCQTCLRHCVRSRSPSVGGHMTQVTFAEDRRSPSIHSHSSVSPKRNGRLGLNGYKEAIDLQELNSGQAKAPFTALCKQNGSSPNKNVAYSPLPTDSTTPTQE